jgi:hypothetical protein
MQKFCRRLHKEMARSGIKTSATDRLMVKLKFLLKKYKYKYKKFL